jgi:hypothetical protein
MKLPVIFGAAAVALAACAASRTTIQSKWADAAYSGPPLDRIAVVALFDTRADSLSFERSAADYLATQGVAIVPGHELLGTEETRTLDETEMRERLAAADVDGLLIVRLIAVDERREYQVPTPYLPSMPPDLVTGDPSSWYYTPSSDYYWYWRSSAAVTAAPGYWIEQSFVVAETALFDNRNDRLLWTAKSETMEGERFQRTTESLVRAVARELFAADLIMSMAASSPQHAQLLSRVGPEDGGSLKGDREGRT